MTQLPASTTADSSSNPGEQPNVKTATRSRLPDTKNVDGRAVWEPPIFCYDELIGEEYEQKRKGYLKYTNGDVATTTHFLDVLIEADLLVMYAHWLDQNENAQDQANRKFFQGLRTEVSEDHFQLGKEWRAFDIQESRLEDRTWEIKPTSKFVRRRRRAEHERYSRTHVTSDSITQAVSVTVDDTLEEEPANTAHPTTQRIRSTTSGYGLEKDTSVTAGTQDRSTEHNEATSSDSDHDEDDVAAAPTDAADDTTQHHETRRSDSTHDEDAAAVNNTSDHTTDSIDAAQTTTTKNTKT